MDQIVAHSGVVKQTVYNYFTGKDALFKATVEHLLAESRLELSLDWYALDAQEFLTKLARAQLKLLQSPANMDFLRLLVKESRRFPELQTMYACSIPGPVIEFIAGYIMQCPTAAFGLKANSAAALTLAWTFRAILTGYATLSNLTTLVRETLPVRSVFISYIARLFDAILADPGPVIETLTASAPGRAEAGLLGAEEAAQFFRPGARQKISAKRLAILRAAVNTYSQHGFAAASMDEVAQAADVSKQTIYQHFGSKNKLYADVFQEVLAHLGELNLGQEASLADFCRAHVQHVRRPWLLEYCRAVIGESQSFPGESGLLMLYFVSLGRSRLEQILSTMASARQVPGRSESELLLAVLIRSLLGSYILFRQIYVLGENPYLCETGLISAIERLADLSFAVTNLPTS